MKYRVIEDQLKTVAQSDNREDAIIKAQILHEYKRGSYHEVYYTHEKYGSTGCFQLKPGDCMRGIPLSDPDLKPWYCVECEYINTCTIQ